MRMSGIVAVALDGTIGIRGNLPWKLRGEMAHFKRTTTEQESVVLMGRTSWDSIESPHRPLSGRRNIVLSKDPNFHARGAEVCHSKKEVLELIKSDPRKVFVIGGSMIYDLFRDDIDTWYVTNVIAIVRGDVKIPRYWDGWKEVSRRYHPTDSHNVHAFEILVFERT